MKTLTEAQARDILRETIIETGPTKLSMPEDAAIERLLWWVSLAAGLHRVTETLTATKYAKTVERLQGTEKALRDAAESLDALIDDWTFIHVCQASGMSLRTAHEVVEINSGMADAIHEGIRHLKSGGGVIRPSGKAGEAFKRGPILILAAAFLEVTGRRPGLSKDEYQAPTGPFFRFAKGCLQSVDIPFHSDEALAKEISRFLDCVKNPLPTAQDLSGLDAALKLFHP